MPADLQAVVVVADVVGVMDGPGRQPFQPVVEDLERVDVGGDRLQHRAALMRREGRVTVLRQFGPMLHSSICTSVP